MTIKIRSSSFNSYFDCPRRECVKIQAVREMICDAGFTLREERGTSIAAVIGTGVHAAAEYACSLKKENIIPSLNDVVENGIVGLKKQYAKGIEVYSDSAAKNRSEAELQTSAITQSFYYEVLPQIDPVGVEVFRKASLNRLKFHFELTEQYELTGHIDIENANKKIIDWKTSLKNYHAQQGAYILLDKCNGIDIDKISLWFLPRKPDKESERKCVEIPYNVTVCENAAFACVKHIIRDIENFKASQDPFVFAFNPMSRLCSEKYCQAYNTNWCELTL